MDVKDIKKILDAVAESEVNEFALETGDYKLTIKRGQEPVMVPPLAQQPVAAPAALPASAPPAAHTSAPQNSPGSAPAGSGEAAAAPAASNLTDVAAPIVGTFYAAPSPDADDFVKVGARVEAGAVLCIIEAMKLMNEIEAEVAGTIAEVLVDNEDPVEYGQVLFRIKPS